VIVLGAFCLAVELSVEILRLIALMGVIVDKRGNTVTPLRETR
jgi:hypothetical protein